jgi:hypothetical protein
MRREVVSAQINQQSKKKPSSKTRGASAIGAGRSEATKYWSGEVTRTSNALDLEPDVFTWDDPGEIARSLKRSAEASQRRKAPPFRSAMSMLVFYLNRAGKNLSSERKRVLENAKNELRKEFGRPLR